MGNRGDVKFYLASWSSFIRETQHLDSAWYLDCSGRRLHWLFGQWIRTSCPLTVLFCTHVTELETQIHVRICARSGALIASAIRLSQCLHPTRPLQGATLVRHTPLAGSSGLSRAVGAGFHVVPVLPGLTARNIPYPLQGYRRRATYPLSS